jgi:hypothetical protein
MRGERLSMSIAAVQGILLGSVNVASPNRDLLIAADQVNPRTTRSERLSRLATLTSWPYMAAARRAVINRASRDWPPRLWSSVRATDRMFIQRYPEGDRPVLPRCGTSGEVSTDS